MGDIKEFGHNIIHKPLKALGQIAPFALAAFGGGLFGGGSIFGWELNALQGFSIGSTLAGLGNKKKIGPEGGTAGQGLYGFGKPENTLTPDRVIPIVYGECRVSGGNIFWYKQEDTGQLQKEFVALCGGEVESVTDVRINNRPIADFDSCTADTYTGTAVQTPDARADNYRGSVKGLAYIAATVKNSEALRGQFVLSALVKGRKVPVYDGANWTTQYSNNPAWVMRDVLVNFLRVPTASIDTVTFYAAAQKYDEEPTGEYDRGTNFLLGKTATGSTTPEYATDGSLTNNNLGWWRACLQGSEDLYELGVIDAGAEYYTNFIKIFLADWADNCWWYNYKVAVSTNGADYTTVFDGTGSGVDYRGVQYVSFAAQNVRYIKIWGSGSETHPNFHVKEVEAYELVQAKRGTLNGIINNRTDGREILEDMLISCNSILFYSGGQYKLKLDEDEAAVLAFDTTNIEDKSLQFKQTPRTDKANRVKARFICPSENWVSAFAVDNDTLAQQTDGLNEKEIALPFCTSESQAARIARQAGNFARKIDWTANYNGAYDVLGLEPADIVTITNANTGWTTKPFRINNISTNMFGGCTITALEHVASIYGDQASAYIERSEETTLEDPADPPRHVTGLTLTEDKDQLGDGTWSPKILVSFTRPTGGTEWVAADIEIKPAGGAYKVVGRTGDAGTFEIRGLQKGTQYYVRVVSVNAAGVRAPIDTAPIEDITLVGKASAPSDVPSFNYSLAKNRIDLRWGPATDVNNDLDHYEIRDGAIDWAGATVLTGADDLRTTAFSFKPTKRSYTLWIKAFDRTGNESADATKLEITVTPPQVSGTPVLADAPPLGHIITWDNVASSQVLIYNIHRSSSGAGFTPSAANLVAQAAPGVLGIGSIIVYGLTDATTYYYKICATDYLSDAVGDQYDYPSNSASRVARMIESTDLTTTGLYLAPSGGRAPFIRIYNDAGTPEIVGSWGKYSYGGSDYYGLWARDFLRIGGEADPDISLQAGVARIKNSVIVGASGSTDVMVSSGQSMVNLCPNGGFEQQKRPTTTYYSSTSDTALIPCWTLGYVGGASATIVAKYTYPTKAHIGKYSIQTECSATKRVVFTGTKFPVIAGTDYTLSGFFRVDTATPTVPLIFALYWYDKTGTYISASYAANGTAIDYTSMTRIYNTLTAPANACFAAVIMSGSYTASGTNLFVYDCLQVEVGKNVTTYTEPSTDMDVIIQTGCVIDSTGYNVYENSAGGQTFRAGNIGGLSNGVGGSIAANTMGIWNKGGFYFLDAAGNAMFAASGLTTYAYVNGTIAKAILTSATQTLIQDGTDDSRPHDYHIGLIATDVTSLSTAAPLTIAHGQANNPIVVAQLRGYDDGTSVYSKWHNLPFTTFYSTGGSVPGGNTYECTAYVTVDTTNVRLDFHLMQFTFDAGADHCSGGYYGFDSTNKASFWLRKADNTLSNIWDKIQMRYYILKQGSA